MSPSNFLFAALFSLVAFSRLLACGQEPAPKFTLGEARFIPVTGKKTDDINDSVFPFLPNQTATGRIAFWGDAIVLRYTGPDLDHLSPPPGNAMVAVTTAPGTDSSWSADGTWMLTATRAADGVLVGFVHGEDHTFADGKYGEWNSTGVWTSEDDGVSWVNQGEVVGSKKADVHAFGGMALNECLWDEQNKRWLGYSSAYAFASSDPHGKPGTWRGYHDGDFTQPIDVNAPTPALTPAPGLEKAHVTWGGLTYNSYLKKYIMTWEKGKSVEAAFSPDGIHWGPVTTLYQDTAPDALGDAVTYAFILGETDTRSSQDCYLVYMHHPPGKSLSGNRKDMMKRAIHFER